jgi:hypothetical protein
MFKKLLVVAAAMLVTACASPYVATPYDRASANITSIAMVDDALPEKPLAYEVASVGSNFGLIGALVDAGIQAERQNAVHNALEGIDFNAESRLEAHLSQVLQADGYTVAVLPEQARAKREFLGTYPDAGGAQAYLDVVVNGYGYLSSGAGQPFRPYVLAKVKLVRVSDGAKLMENIIVSNPLGAEEGVVTLPPNPEYAFNNRSELLADPNRLAAGIEDALFNVANTAARLLH